MKGPVRIDPVLGITGALTLCVGLATAMLLLMPLSASEAVPEGGADDTRAEVPAARPGDPVAVDIAPIIGRPIFNEGRRADPPPAPPAALEPPPEPAVAQAPETPPLRLVLAGIAIAGEGRIALMRGASGEMLRLRPGDAVEGWVVLSVEPAAVTFRAGEKLQRIEFRKRHGDD